MNHQQNQPNELAGTCGPHAGSISPGHADLIRAATEAGAARAAIISRADILVDPRVRLKCLIPTCYSAGICKHCPPHGYSVDRVREIVSRYETAVFFAVSARTPLVVASGVPQYIASRRLDAGGAMASLSVHFLLVYQIAALLQRRARTAGMEPFGFAATSCRDILCFFRPGCRSLAGGSCRHPELSMPAMEACGLDVFSMAANAGWAVYPIGGSCRPHDTPAASFFGLVLLDRSIPRDPSTRSPGSSTSAQGHAPDQHGVGTGVSAPAEIGAMPMDWRIVVGTWRERTVFLQVLRNFRVLEGSWMAAVRKLMSIYAKG